MKRQFVNAAALMALVLSSALFAAPYAGTIFELEQPDGTVVQVRFWGDEYYCRGESLDGYTVVRDAGTGWIVYAELNEDASEFVPTAAVYDDQVSTDPNHPMLAVDPFGRQRAAKMGKGRGRGLEKQLRQRQDVVEAKHLRRRMELHPERFMEAADDAFTDGTAAAAAIAPAPLTGSVVGLTILVEFQDVRGTIAATEIEKFCNQRGYTGYGNNGSVRDYYYDVSNGLLDYTNIVTNYVLLNNTKGYYDACGDWGKTGEVIDEALAKLCAQGFNFSSLTKGSNGRVLALNILYAGSPNCGWSEGLWPHMSSRNVTVCGTAFGAYQITNIGSSLRLGTFCHENGHMICGYPDLYDYTSTSNGVGNFCLMSYGGPSDNPVPPCTYLRWTTGWETITNITNDSSGTVRTHTANTNTSFRYSHPTSTKQYFLVESRLKTGRHSGLPAEGLLVWRINEDGNNAYPTAHPTHPYRKSFRVALEQADGQFHLERRSGYGDSNDSFRSGYKDSFDDFTAPDAVWWDGSFSGFSLSKIGAVGGQVSFTVGAGFFPTAHYTFEGNYNDVSGSGYHGSAANFPVNNSQWLAASFDGSYAALGGSLQFDGVDDYIELPAAVGATDEIGIAFWMKPDQVADMIPLDKHPNNSTGAGWSVRLRSDGRIVFRVGSDLSAFAVGTRGPVYEAGRWTHVACSYKGGTVRIFVNGQLRAMQHGLTVTSKTSALNVRMGIPAQAMTDWRYKGALDDVRFYAVELTDGRLKAVDGLNLKPGKGVTLHLPLDEQVGTTAEDRSRHEKHGTLKSGQTFDADSVAAVVGRGLRFDGTNDHIQVPGGFDKMNGGFTVSMWVYPTAVKNWARFIDFGNGSAASNIVLARYQTTNDLAFQVYNGSTASGYVRATNAITLNAWQHITATVTANGAGVLYKNGQVVATGTTGTGLNVYRTVNYIGRSNWSADAYYQGNMDEIRLYNYALSADEVQAVYQNRRVDAPYPINGANDVNPNAILTWGFPDGTARHDIYFGSSFAAVAAATPQSPEYRGRRQEARYKPAGLEPWREYFWRVDTLLTDGSVVPGPLWSFSTVGGVIRQVWEDITGNPVTNLTSNAAYPNNPTTTEYIRDFEGPTDWKDNYGTRIMGQLWPTVSGLHTFWIASDDYSELWLSTTPNAANAANAAKLASVSGSTGSREWDRFTSQKTQQITLVAGNRYYIMALHKEGVGGDNLAVAWQGPSCPVRSVIDGFWLRPMPENEWPVFTAMQLPTLTAAEGKPLNQSIAGSASDPDGTAVTYRKKSGPTWLKVASNGQLSGTPRDSDTGLNSFIIHAADDKDDVDESMLSIDVSDLYTGSRGVEDVLPFAALWLSETPGNPADLTGSGRTDYADWNLFSKNWQQEIADGLVAYWTMDDATGLTVRDANGRYDGTMTNMSVYAWAKGYLGNALVFDGVDDYVEIPGFKGISGTASRTCTARIKTSKSPGEILSWGSTGNGAKWIVRINEDGTLRAEVNNGYLYGTTVLTDDRWHHIAVVLADNGSPQVNDIQLYVDGQRETIAAVLNHPVNTASSQDVRIGAFAVSPRYFRGVIDDVRIYDRALNAQEINRQAFQATVAHWSFNEGTGSQTVDTVSGYNGQLVNMNAANWVPGVEGYALDFDGVNDYVEIPGFKGITGGASRTCSAWIKTTKTAAEILTWGSTDVGAKWVIRTNENGTLRAEVSSGYLYGSTVLTDNQWHHIAVVLEDDGSPTVEEIRLYVDGVLETNGEVMPQKVNTAATQEVRIGAYAIGPRYFRGQIDDVRIYDRAMQDDEIPDLMY